jgi:hypothetical protein
MDNKYKVLIRYMLVVFVLELLNLTLWSNLNIIYLLLSDFVVAVVVIIIFNSLFVKGRMEVR